MTRDPRPDLDPLLAAEFPLEPGLVYLNHAAVAPWPRRTADAVRAFAEENARRGAAQYAAWLEVERRVRARCAALVNATPDDIALLKNTSEALSVVAHGFPWRPGDNVVIADEEFPSNRIVWESLRPRGVEVREVALGADPEEALLAAADGRTRLISVSSVQYASGRRTDLAALGAACRQRGIAFCVDAIQGLGALPHDVDAMHIDFLMADAHKWLLGPEGIAVFYCRDEWRGRLALYQYGWHMVERAGDFERKDWEPARSARRFECGSPNMLGIHALDASLSLLLEVGIEHIERRVLARAERLFELIRARPDLELITPAAPGRYGGIVTFRHRRRTAAELHARLRERNIICAARGGGVRLSPHFYTPLAGLEHAVACAAE
ncbi:MAG TPA: aminotransferase class V-fold PLP-dependent enzyme [Burkholderiales bacterium]